MGVKAKVLFVCIHNSARSQIAEAYLNKFGEGEVVAESAGFKPGKLNPLVIKAMQEEGIDISHNSCDSVFDFFKEGKRYSHIVTVCDEGSAEQCPVFPGVVHRIHWSFRDPSALEGDDEERMQKTRVIRDAIKGKVLQFISLMKTGNLAENAPVEWRFQR